MVLICIHLMVVYVIDLNVVGKGTMHVVSG